MEDRENRREIRRLLWRWGKVTATCARKQRELREYQDLIASVADVHSSPLTGMPGGGKISDATARAAERLIFLRGRYQEMIDILYRQIDEEIRFARAMDEVMNKIQLKERNILELRYRNTWSYERISMETHYSPAQVKRLENKGVTIIGKMISITKDDTF